MPAISITIAGMSCGHCLNAVNKALAQVPGIEVESVRLGRADLRVPDSAATSRVEAALREAGYPVDAVVER